MLVFEYFQGKTKSSLCLDKAGNLCNQLFISLRFRGDIVASYTSIILFVAIVIPLSNCVVQREMLTMRSWNTIRTESRAEIMQILKFKLYRLSNAAIFLPTCNAALLDVN